jgi:hypothetical protein
MEIGNSSFETVAEFKHVPEIAKKNHERNLNQDNRCPREIRTKRLSNTSRKFYVRNQADIIFSYTVV